MIKLPVYAEPHPECWKIYEADKTYLCSAQTKTKAAQIVAALNAQQPKEFTQAKGIIKGMVSVLLYESDISSNDKLARVAEQLNKAYELLNAQQPASAPSETKEENAPIIRPETGAEKPIIAEEQPSGELVRLLEKVREDIAEDKGFDILTDKCANPNGCPVCLLTKALALHKQAATRIEALEKALRESLQGMDKPAVQASGEWQTGLFCGLEDRNITDRYEACMYGYEQALEKVQEWVLCDFEAALGGQE